jgi:PadR family transcriptional regulator PadR
MTDDVRVTTQTARVLAAMLEDPTAAHYGLDVMQRAGLASGSLYPILRRLEAASWMTSAWEQVDAAEVGRPRRRYYSLTPHGIQSGRRALAELSALGGTTKGRTRLRPGLAGGAR